MTNKLVVAFACLGFAANASAAADINFDKNIDVKSVIEQAKTTEVNKDFYPQQNGTHSVRYSRDCRNLPFGASPYAQSSGRVYLDSTEYIEECHFVPKPPPPPPPPPVVNPPNNGGHNGGNNGGNHGGQPGGNNGGNHGGQPGGNNGGNHGGQPGGHGPKAIIEEKDGGPHQGEYSHAGSQNGHDGTWVCRERAGQTFRATAQLNVAPRQLYPWESESFNVCMEGQRVDFNTGSSPYSYSVDRVGLYDLTFNLTPNYRVPTAPDADGLYATGFSHKDGKFTLSVGDRWAREYAGETVLIKVELMKDGFLFFNSNKGEKTFTFSAASGYELVFAEGDLTKTKEFVDDSADKGAKKYFVKWGFQRVGRVSTNDYVKKGDTEKIPV